MRTSLTILLIACVVSSDVRAVEEPLQDDDDGAIVAARERAMATYREGALEQYESTAQELLDLSTAAEQTIQNNGQDVNFVVSELNSQIQQLLVATEALRQKEEHLVYRTQRLDAKIQQANVMQLDYLANQLLDDVKLESEARAQAVQIPRARRVESLSGALNLSEYEEKLDPEKAMATSELDIKNWFIGIAQDEVDLFQFDESQKKLASAKKTKQPRVECMSPMDAALKVHGAIVNYENDVIGMVDHAKGATIVHELTSNTFVPPPEPDELMGNVWWRKYVPSDWEQALPSGWEGWNVAVPSVVQHALGIRDSATVPPEAILDGSIIPGSCWPMSGSKGHVTIRLPYPVTVSALTLDHASPHLLSESMEFTSAPRKIRVIGYPPCTDDCRGMGFDLSKGSTLATMDYDKDGRHIQTFEISGGDASLEGECAESKEILGSCSAPPSLDEALVAPVIPEAISKEVSGIKLEILSNWGVEEYTCLYRFRVHGQAQQ
jgi:SUN domain-containing protein 1/2